MLPASSPFRQDAGCSCLIISVPLLVAILLAVLLFRQDLFPPQMPPEKLPSLPTPAIKIEGVDTGGFYAEAPYIRATDGQLYSLDLSESGWEVASPNPDLDTGNPCKRKSLEPIEAVAGPIDDCLVVQTIGERCPGPLVAFAIAQNGDVWRIRHLKACTIIFSTVCAAFLVLGLIMGLLFAGFRQLILRFT